MSINAWLLNESGWRSGVTRPLCRSRRGSEGLLFDLTWVASILFWEQSAKGTTKLLCDGTLIRIQASSYLAGPIKLIGSLPSGKVEATLKFQALGEVSFGENMLGQVRIVVVPQALCKQARLCLDAPPGAIADGKSEHLVIFCIFLLFEIGLLKKGSYILHAVISRIGWSIGFAILMVAGSGIEY